SRVDPGRAEQLVDGVVEVVASADQPAAFNGGSAQQPNGEGPGSALGCRFDQGLVEAELALSHPVKHPTNRKGLQNTTSRDLETKRNRRAGRRCDVDVVDARVRRARRSG